jgi:hypothetical protein
MFMKLKYTTRHLNFYFLKIHILRLLFCVYIVSMAGFVLASRRNDGQETNKKSFGKSSNKVKRAKRNLCEMDIWFDEADGYTPLMRAAKAGSVHDLTCLVNAGADVNARNNKGETAIIIATMHHQYKTVKALLRHDADITHTDGDEKTAVDHAQKFTIFDKRKWEESIQEANRGIEDLLCLRFAHDYMKRTGLNKHIRTHHCGEGEDVLDNGVALCGSKTLFPERWLEDKTVEAITSVLHSPEKLGRESSTKLLAEGNFKDVSKEGNFDVPIKVSIAMAEQGSESRVITAFPLYR